MAFPSYFFLIPYGLFMLAFAVFALINFYNLLKYGGFTFAGFFAVFLFAAGASFVLFLTYINLSGFDWGTPVLFFDSAGDFFKPTF